MCLSMCELVFMTAVLTEAKEGMKDPGYYELLLIWVLRWELGSLRMTTEASLYPSFGNKFLILNVCELMILKHFLLPWRPPSLAWMHQHSRSDGTQRASLFLCGLGLWYRMPRAHC